MKSYFDELIDFLEEMQEDENTNNEILATDIVQEDIDSIDSIGAITTYAQQNHLKITDNRSKNVAFWVLHRSIADVHAEKLRSFGMKFKIGKGWWIL